MGYSTHTRTARAREVKRTLWIILGLNVLVAVAKMAWGAFIGSVAMLADGFHSLFDGASNVVGLVGMTAAERPPDPGHPYGHGKYETVASLAIGALLALAAWRVGAAAWQRLIEPGQSPKVDAAAFGIMVGTLLVNFAVTTYERRRGKALASDILLADARHTTSDMIVSIGVIASLVAVRLGFPRADPIIGLVVALVIAWTAWQVFREANVILSDSARVPAAGLKAAALQVPGVLGAHDVRTRGSQSEVYVDMHVQVAADSTIGEAHTIAETVERLVCEKFPEVADVLVHIEPQDEYQARKTAEQLKAD